MSARVANVQQTLRARGVRVTAAAASQFLTWWEGAVPGAGAPGPAGDARATAACLEMVVNADLAAVCEPALPPNVATMANGVRAAVCMSQ